MPTPGLNDWCFEGLITFCWITPKRVVSSVGNKNTVKVKLKVGDYKKVESKELLLNKCNSMNV